MFLIHIFVMNKKEADERKCEGRPCRGKDSIFHMLPHFPILEKIKEAAEGLSRRIAGTLRERLPDTGHETADPW